MPTNSEHYFKGDDAFSLWGEANAQFMYIFVAIIKVVNKIENGKRITMGFVKKYLMAQQEMMNLILGMSKRILDLEKRLDELDNCDNKTI